MKKEKKVNLLNVKGFDRYSDVYTKYKWEGEPTQHGNIWMFESGRKLHIQSISQGILRCEFMTEGGVPYPDSFAVADNQLTTAESGIHVQYKYKKLQFEDDEARVLTYLTEGVSVSESVNEGVFEIKLIFDAPEDEVYYGLGDKSGALNLRGQKLENWNQDAYNYNEKSDPLYKSVPFFVAVRKGICWGLFLDNTHRSSFDFDSNNRRKLKITAAGLPVRFYFFSGKTPLEIVQQYAQLTGTHALPPIWALGYHQSRWSYFPEERVREVANSFRAHQIPCDALYLDIDYMLRFKCFTWNNAYFPDPQQLIADLKADGFSTVLMVDPGIKQEVGYDIYDEGVKEGMFCRRPSGELMVGLVWPGRTVFPDFANAKVRHWFGNLYKEHYQVEGVAGFWNDMNEPALFKIDSKTMPNNVLHHIGTRQTDHKEIHNVYGSLMSQATWEGLLRLKPDTRPFLLTRATFSGGQKYAAVWTGDNASNWQDLMLANRQCQRLSISGFSFCGSDIGGFSHSPDGELFVRWLQLSVFHPLMRVHTQGGHLVGDDIEAEDAIQVEAHDERIDQEPWSYGAPFTSAARAAIELRYMLLPYLYTTFWQHQQDGTPVLLPISFVEPHEPFWSIHEREFMFGPNILVSPIIKQGADHQRIKLPAGKWFGYNDALPYQSEVEVKTDLFNIPMFVKAGCVLPIHPVTQHTKQVPAFVTLRIFVGTQYASVWYVDEGENHSYKYSNYCLSKFSVDYLNNELTVLWQREGDYRLPYPTYCIEIIGLESVVAVSLDDQLIASNFDGNIVKFEINTPFSKLHLTGH